MGMDLYSKRGDEYYRFNWSGWSNVCNFLSSRGCDLSEFAGSNDGDVVPAKSCKAIADTLDKLRARLTELMTCPGKDLLTHTNEDPVLVTEYKDDREIEVDIIKAIIDTRLKSGKKMNPKKILDADRDPWDVWARLGYYLDFGTDFCRKCSKLGGFKQC